MWEERLDMGPPPGPVAAPPDNPRRATDGGGVPGLRVPLAGWKAQKTGRYLAGAVFVLGGFLLAGLFFVVVHLFSIWGSGPTTTDALVQFACIAGGCIAAAAVIWPVLGERGPELVLDEHYVRFHHPDLVTDMVVERAHIMAIHAGHGAGPRVFELELGLNAFDGTNFEMVFTSPQRIPRARVLSQLSPFFSMRAAREVPGLRLRVADVDWARQVFGTMPQYRALTDQDYAAAGIDLQRRSMQPLGIALVAIAVCINIARHWVF